MSSLPTVSRETCPELNSYVALLLKWNKAINLVAASTEADVWTRHIEDAVQTVAHIPDTARTLMDMGSGAGLPGMVIAIARPDIRVVLLERDSRKAAFLQEAIARLCLRNASVSCESVEAHKGTYDCITARALASLKRLCDYSYPHMHKETICLFAKGKNYANELSEAQKEWQFHYHLHKGAIQEESVIVSLSQLSAIP
jgi:16S rRNA (guanine527-N7)-methyltransferase